MDRNQYTALTVEDKVALCAALDAERRRYGPPDPARDDAPPAEVRDGDGIGVAGADLDWRAGNPVNLDDDPGFVLDERFEVCVPPEWGPDELDRYEAEFVERYIERHVGARERASRAVSDFDQAHYFGGLAGLYDRP